MHRLQPVAGIGQRARNDDAHGVIEIGVAHLLINVNAVYYSDIQTVPHPGLIGGRLTPRQTGNFVAHPSGLFMFDRGRPQAIRKTNND